VRDQAPIGTLFDELWKMHRAQTGGPAKTDASGRQGGNIGILTQGCLDRSAYGAQAVICGLIRFLHTDLYD
jgi:non-canonical (house-cleaning) NTP pyrophosphatase